MKNRARINTRTKRRAYHLGLLVISLLCFKVNLHADQCNLLLIDHTDSAIIEYDPFLAASALQKVQFELLNEGSESCTFDIVALTSIGEPSLTYAVANSNLRFDLRPADNSQLQTNASTGVYSASIPANVSKLFEFDAIVMQDDVLAAQDHIVSVQFQLREPGSVSPNGPAWTSDVILRSVPRAQINVTGTAGSFGEGSSMNIVDFGLAQSGAKRKLFIQIRANTLSQLSIASQNQGKLHHKEKPDTAQPIPYTAHLTNEEIDLSGIVIRNYDLPPSYQGESLPFELTLGEVAGAMAGDYEDILTIEFSPL